MQLTLPEFSAEIHLHLKALQTNIRAFFWTIYVNRANFYKNIFLPKKKVPNIYLVISHIFVLNILAELFFTLVYVHDEIIK